MCEALNSNLNIARKKKKILEQLLLMNILGLLSQTIKKGKKSYTY
jgi:hypothetical protein